MDELQKGKKDRAKDVFPDAIPVEQIAGSLTEEEVEKGQLDRLKSKFAATGPNTEDSGLEEAADSKYKGGKHSAGSGNAKQKPSTFKPKGQT